MQYHEQLNKVRGIAFYIVVAAIAVGFILDYLRR